jgi:acetyl esterase/lipase
MKYLRFVLMSLLTTLLMGCQASLMRSMNVPYAFAPVAEHSASYGADAAHRMSIYRPRSAKRVEASEQALPVLLFFYGGSWRNGERAWYRFVAKHYALQGFVVMVPDYRKAPEHTFPSFMEDAAASFAYAKQHAQSHGGDPTKIIVFGHSAGAHIGALLSLDPTYLRAHQLRLRDIRGFIGIAGPYDFLPMTADDVIEVFNGDAHLAASQPIHFARALDQPAAPMLLIHGRRDWLVWPKNSTNLALELRRKGVRVKHVELPNAGHFTPLFQAGRGLNWLSPSVDQAIAEFVQTLQ